MSEMMIAPVSANNYDNGFEYLVKMSREFKSEVERLRDILYETRVTTGRVAILKSHHRAPWGTNYPPSTFLIAILLQTLLDRDDRIDFLHRQLAANTKRLAELNERALEYQRQATYLGNTLNQIFAEIGYPTCALDQRAVELVIERLVGIIRNLPMPKPRSRRRHRRSVKRRYGIK